MSPSRSRTSSSFSTINTLQIRAIWPFVLVSALRRSVGSIRREGSFAPDGLLLAGPHTRIDAAPQQQVRVVAALDDMPAVQHHDLIGIDDRRETVGDDERRSAGGY